MKRITMIFMAAMMLLVASAQSLKFTFKSGLIVLANADEAGEMVISGSQLSVGQEVFDLSDIETMEYLPGNFDPQMVEVDFAGSKSYVTVPLALLPQLQVEQDGAYVTLTSSATSDPEITYALSGQTQNGGFTQVGEYKCGILLKGVDITSQRGAAIHIKNGKRIDVELRSGSVNRLADYKDGIQDACFHIKGHPEFKGAGSLYLTGNARHAYKSGEYTLLKRSIGKIQVLSAVSDAMHIGQYFEMRGGDITIQSGVKGDGIQVEKNSDPLKERNGFMQLDSGKVNITLASDDVSAIKCDSTFSCNGGEYTITVSGKFSKGVNVPYNAYVRALNGATKFDITASGGYLTINGDKKKSTCFKVDGDLYFYEGTIKTQATGDKSRGLKVGKDYYYVPTKAVLTPNTPDVGGAMRVLSAE